jgi:hypothetical protein
MVLSLFRKEICQLVNKQGRVTCYAMSRGQGDGDLPLSGDHLSPPSAGRQPAMIGGSRPSPISDQGKPKLSSHGFPPFSGSLAWFGSPIGGLEEIL